MRLLILTISYAPNVGGVETHLSDWVRWLWAQPDIETDVLTYQPITTNATGPSFEQDGRLRIFRVRWFGRTLFHGLESRPALQFLYLAPRLLVAALVHFLRHGRPDLVHAHGLAAAWVAARLKRLFRVPVVVSLHAIYSFPPESKTARRIARVLRPVDRILTLSDASVGQLVAYGLPRECVGRYTYWVDQGRFRPMERGECRRRWGLEEGRFTALFVGRLIAIKGVDLMLELARRLPDVNFAVAGDGPMQAECERAARACPNLRFFGRQPNEALPTLYNAANVLLVPSQYEEGYGRVACEALSCGTMVIAADSGGLREVLSGEVGWLVVPSPDRFEAALREEMRVADPERQRWACRAHAEAVFGVANAEELWRNLERVAGGSPSPKSV